jgi:hypothetical protein
VTRLVLLRATLTHLSIMHCPLPVLGGVMSAFPWPLTAQLATMERKAIDFSKLFLSRHTAKKDSDRIRANSLLQLPPPALN